MWITLWKNRDLKFGKTYTTGVDLNVRTGAGTNYSIKKYEALTTDGKKIRKGMEEAIKYIKKLDGFVGVHPVDLWHTLLLFDIENNAKGARNLLIAKDIQCANYIVPILIETKYLR